MRVIVPLAEGFEEIEAVSIIDVLRRAGAQVTTAYLKANPVTGSHSITVTADTAIDGAAAGDYDCIALPGGMPGSENLKNDSRVIALVRDMAKAGKITAALCAAPMVLGAAGVLAGRRATCYPGFEDSMTGARPVGDPVVRDGAIVTARGPGCAIPFALEILSALGAKGIAENLKESMQVYWM